MPWFVPWSESIKKRACRYLLQRYLGQFFEEKLTLNQLSVDLYNGTGTVADISLDVQALNELGEQQNWPMEFVDGYVQQMSISVPWSALLKESSNIEVRGLNITIQPKQRSESGTSMFESMWSSMTSSMQLAQECLKQESPNTTENAQPLEGIERFAQTIDSILCRVKVKFINTVIRLEHVPKDCNNGVAIQINIQNMEYLDEAGNDPPTGQAAELSAQEQNKAYIVSSFTTKKFFLEGVTFSTDEFPSKARTFCRSMIDPSNSSSNMDTSKVTDDEFLSTIIEDHVTKTAERKKKISESEYYMSCTDFEDNLGDRTPITRTPTQEEKSRNVFANVEHAPILFGKLSGRQEVRLRLKQSEAVVGPKVSLEVTLGSFTLFLSPRQVHVLLELAEGMASPHLEDTSNVPKRQRCTEKPMGDLDFQRVEQELQQQLNPVASLQTTGLQNTQGWSTAPLDYDDNDVDFLPMRNASMSESVLSAASSMESSVLSSVSSASSKTSSQIPTKSKRRVSNADLDPTADITKFQIRLASLALVLLHEDLLTVSSSSEQTLVPSSVTQMKHTADTFFNSLGFFAVSGYGNKDFDKAKTVFEKACLLNHIRLLAAPIQIEGDEKTTSTSNSITGNLTAAKLELLECLWNEGQGTVEYVQLLTFNDEHNSTSSPIGAKPCMKIDFKYLERVVKNGRQKITYPKTDLIVHLDSALVEVDISIIDRIRAVLNSQPVCVKNGTPIGLSDGAGVMGAFSQATDMTTLSEYRYDIKIMSPVLNVKLRFPVPDLRPVHDMQRTPWWKRNVRPDYLNFKLIDMTIQSSIRSKQTCFKYELQCRSVDIYYTEAEIHTPMHIARGAVDEKSASSLPDGFNWPRIVMEVYPVIKMQVQLEEGAMENEAEPGPYSMDAFGVQTSKNPSPFSAKRIVHESDTPHTKPHQEDTEELIIPGDRHEMSQFIEHSIHSSQIRLDLFLPSVSVQLISKHIYELIYNRINTDLLLWESGVPKPKVNVGFEGAPLNCDLQESIYPTFSMCKSGIQFESESESEEEADVENEGVFYSVYEGRNSRYNKRPAQLSDTTHGQSFLSLNMHIMQGVFCMHTPARDITSNVIPEQHGEFLFTVEDASLFTVSQFMGNPDLSYVCVQGRSASLHHCDLTGTPSQSPPLKEIGSALPRHLHPTIYKSEPGVVCTSSSRAGERDMLSVAVRIQASHETHHVKTIRVAVGVKKATLRHRMCVEPNSWFSQLVDFFDVLDYPIPGYIPMGVLTELHLHLWDCAIDYRPLYLPLRSVLTLGSFTMSSHLTAQANTSTLRFIAEDCGLFLSDRAPPKGGIPSLAPVDLRKDYVSVIDLSLFELSLRLSDKFTGMNPHVDLRASNNVLHIRTCSDTGRALMQLITYFAGDGDLTAQPVGEYVSGSSTHSTPRKQPPSDASEQLLNVDQPQDISNLSKSQHQHVNELLGEAMKESLAVRTDVSQVMQNSQSTGVDVFFFPDESQPLPPEAAVCKPATPVAVKRNVSIAPSLQSNKSSDTDEEFYFVGDEAGLGILPKSGLPEIRWLTEDPVRIIDNHFSIPVGKTDLLKPPKHFPVAVLRYTLCEMTLIWHMYGGYDFKSTKKEESDKNKKTVNFSDTVRENLDGGVTYCKTALGEINFTNTPDKKFQNMSWQIKGGIARDHDVLMELQLNKVRFQHEVYPNDTIQASRQVLLVSELEIRDRLASSHFNKFLYQHTSQARPKQSHANMIVIKATHIRPDPKLSAQECCLRVSLLPLRLNIDQDSLLFVINFFNELGGDVNKAEEDGATVSSSRHTTPTHQPPVMTVTMENQAEVKEQAQKLVSDNLLILLEEDQNKDEESEITQPVLTNTEDSPPIYFREVVFSPEVPIRLDYQGKRVDMTHGPLAGLLMGLGQLNCSELHLKRLSHRHGLLGVDKLLSYVLHEWLQDIKKRQLPSLLGGFGPMHSFVQLFQGIRDLFWLPIEQYQKDGRLVRGLQRGANSFTTSTAMAALELTSKIIHLIQATAETAYDMVSPGPSVRRRPKGHKGRRKHTQPQDIREGMANAYMVVKEGIGETADTIVRVASQEHEQKGYSGAVGGVLRQIPPTFVKPIIIASEATNNVLDGMRSQLVPDARREANQKWRSEEG